MSSEKIDYLLDDNKINNQTYACMSLITPATLKGCSKYLLKCRGVYGNEARAIDRCKELNKKDPTFGVYKVDVGKWIAWKDNAKEDEDPNDELNELMQLYKKGRSESKLLHEKRKEELQKRKKEEEKEVTQETTQEATQEVVEDESEDIIPENVKKISYLTEDDEISGQKFYCISFLTADQLENKEDASKFTVRGFKVRGMFNNEEDAKEHCSKLHKGDQNHNIYVAPMGHWVSWSDNTENAEDFEYANKDLNNLMKSHKENQEKAKQFTAEQKQQMMNESLNTIKKNDKVSNIVSEIIDDSFEEDINLEELENEDTNLDDVNKELEEARKMYEKLLKEQKNK